MVAIRLAVSNSLQPIRMRCSRGDALRTANAMQSPLSANYGGGAGREEESQSEGKSIMNMVNRCVWRGLVTGVLVGLIYGTFFDTEYGILFGTEPDSMATRTWMTLLGAIICGIVGSLLGGIFGSLLCTLFPPPPDKPLSS